MPDMIMNPDQYLDYLTKGIQDAKAKARGWMGASLVSHLIHGMRHGWVENPFQPEQPLDLSNAQYLVDEWSRG